MLVGDTVDWSHCRRLSKVESAGFIDKLVVKNEKKEISRDALDTVHQGWSEQMEKQELPYTQEWAFLWGKEQKWSFVNINIGGVYQYIQIF